MSIKIYVGNYPSTFIEDDVLNLFQDYEGVELCVDSRQLVEIVANLHDIDVCGRNLIVRAADEKFHKKILKSLGGNQPNFQPKNTSEANNGSLNNENDRSSKQCALPQVITSKRKKNYPKKHQMSTGGRHSTTPNNYSTSRRITKPNEEISTYESSDYFSHSYETDYLSQQSTSSSASYLSNGKNIGGNSCCQNTKKIHRREPALGINSQEIDKSTHTKLSERLDSYQRNTLLFKENDGLQTAHTKEGYKLCNKNAAQFLETQNSFSDVKKRSANSQRISESERGKSILSINPQDTFSKISKSKTDMSTHKTISERFDSYKSKSVNNKEHTSSNHSQTTDSTEQHKPRNRNASESSLETVHNISKAELYEKLSFVSVMNFPLHLPVRSLYELFADFEPVKIFTVCNKPRVDRAPTEALVCFENEQKATEAILTLDNTIYQGRVLLVTDTVDMSMVSELLSFGSKS